jgi:hypothetical protein
MSKAGTFKEGQVVRGDNPGVQLNPHLFIAHEGLSDEEFTAAQAKARYAPYASAPAAPPTTTDGVPIRLTRQLRVDELVVCIRGIDQPTRAPGQAWFLRAPIQFGALLAKDDELVKRYPKRFRPATPADMPQ